MLPNYIVEDEIKNLTREEQGKIKLIYGFIRKINKLKNFPGTYSWIIAFGIIFIGLLIDYKAKVIIPYIEKYSVQVILLLTIAVCMILTIISLVALNLFYSRPRLRKIKKDLKLLFLKDVSLASIIQTIGQFDANAYMDVMMAVPRLNKEEEKNVAAKALI